MDISIVDAPNASIVAKLNREVQEEHRLRRPDFFKAYDFHSTLEAVELLLKQKDVHCLIAYTGDQPVGYAIAYRKDYPENPYRFGYQFYLIDQMAVNETHRRLGVATALVKEVKRIAVTEGIGRIQLTVWSDNEIAKQFYRREGFESYREEMEMRI